MGSTPDGGGRSGPIPWWLQLLLLLMTGILVPLFAVSISEDVALSESTTGRLLPGGEGGVHEGQPYCKDAPVEFEVDGRTYAGTESVQRQGCAPAGGEDQVRVRYDPEDPDEFSTSGRQPVLYGLLAASVLGLAVAVLSTVLRVWRRLTRRRAPATPAR